MTRDHRFHIALSAEELNILDNHRFHNRIPTRAKAARDLITRGLAADEMFELLTLANSALSTALNDINVDPAETVIHQPTQSGAHDVTFGEVHCRIAEFLTLITNGGES